MAGEVSTHDNGKSLWLGSLESLEEHNNILAKIEGMTSKDLADLKASMDRDGEPSSNPLVEVIDEVAIININGVLTSDNSFYSLFYGLVPYSMVADALIEAALDEDIKSILLSVDSPGGSFLGIAVALGALEEAAKLKKVYTHTSGLMASAAYWLGSGASYVMADKIAMVGSIGTVAVTKEYTEALKMSGVSAHVFRGGEFKQMGNPYEKLSDKARATIDGEIQGAYDLFIDGVANNRRVAGDVVRNTMAEGKVFFANQALSVNMVDKVVSFNDAFRIVKAGSLPTEGSLPIIETPYAAASAVTVGAVNQTSEELDMAGSKRVVTEKAQNAVAEGADLNKVLDKDAKVTKAKGVEVVEAVDSPVEVAEVKDPDVAVEADGSTELSVDPAVLGTIQAEGGDLKGGMDTLVSKVVELSDSMAKIQAINTGLEFKLDTSETLLKEFRSIACESITRMSVGMGAAVAQTENLSNENVLALYATTRLSFNNSMPVGQQVVTQKEDKEVEAASSVILNKLARLTENKQNKKEVE